MDLRFDVLDLKIGGDGSFGFGHGELSETLKFKHFTDFFLLFDLHGRKSNQIGWFV